MNDHDDDSSEIADSAVFAKAEKIFQRGDSLRGLTIRTDRMTRRVRLSTGGDCEDGMGEFRRVESATRRAGEK